MAKSGRIAVKKGGKVVAKPRTAASAYRFARTRRFSGASVDLNQAKIRPNGNEAAEKWARLWRGIGELVQEFGDRLVFIGGIAVYLHICDVKPPASLVEFSRDGDFFISLQDFSTLRDLEDVVANFRLSKHQIVKHGVEFDVFLEYNNKLVVPYDEALAASVVLPAPTIGDGVRVIGLEHLLILKLAAYKDRRGRTKGMKDERDIIRIAYVLDRRGSIQNDLLVPYLTEDLSNLLVAIKGSHEFLRMSGRNAHQARTLRETFAAVVDAVVHGKKRVERRRR